MFLYLAYRPFLFFINLFLYFKYPKLILVNVASFLLEIFHVYSRVKTTSYSSELTYGEMSYFSVWTCIKSLKGYSFSECIDLGSGMGKPLIFMSMILNSKFKGIEISPQYVDMSKRLISLLNIKFVDIVMGDMSGFEVKGPSLMFFSATCLEPLTIKKLTSRFLTLEKGSVVVSISQKVGHESFKLLFKLRLPMSWGYATVFIQQRC